MIKNIEFKHESDEITDFLTITVPKTVGINMLQVERLADGYNLGCVPCEIFPKIDQYTIRYKKVSTMALDTFIESGLTKDNLLHILKGTISTMEKAQEKGLSIDTLVLDKKHIYLDSFSNKLLFIVLPVRNNVFEKVSMQEFVIDLMLSAPFDEKDDLYFYIKLQNYVTGDKEFSLTGLKEVLAEWDKELVVEPQADEVQGEEPVALVAPEEDLPAVEGITPVVAQEPETPIAQEPVEEQILDAVEAGDAQEEATPALEETAQEAGPVSAPEDAELENETPTTKEEGFDASAAPAKTYSAPSEDLSPNFYSPGQAPILEQASIAGGDEQKSKSSSTINNKLKNENKEKAPFKWFTSTKQDPEPIGNAMLNGPHSSNTVDEGTTVLSQHDDGTTILGVKSKVTPMKPFLVAKASGKETIIDRDEFKLGRDPRRSHLVINNKVVGRLHAKILSIGGEYFLEDVFSRNGTFVNGKRVKPGGKVKIKHDDKLTLANEWFTFRMY